MRLHYAICKSYNADFDGDEMNAHFPQNEVWFEQEQEILFQGLLQYAMILFSGGKKRSLQHCQRLQAISGPQGRHPTSGLDPRSHYFR